MLRRSFSLSLQATLGLLDSLFTLMNVPLCAPDYTCVSKRASIVKVAYRLPPKGHLTDLVIDSTGLKVFGEGKWKVRKHAHDKRRVWRKLHLAIDPATHDIVAAKVTLNTIHDAEVLPTRLNPLRRALGTVFADGAYDTKACHRLITRKGATACIPPCQNAGLWEGNKAVLVMRKEGLSTGRRYPGITGVRWQRRRCTGSSSCWQGKSVCVTTTAKWEKSWRM